MINFEPTTLREHLIAWLSWRITAAHRFAIRSMRLSKETREGSQDIMSAPLGWYLPRFIAGLRAGPCYIIRSKRELRRKAKSVT